MRPRHGTRQRFSQGCKCDPCRKAWNRYNYNRIKARKQGDWRGSVPINKARAHIELLGSPEAVARISGLHRSVITRIVNRKVGGIYRRTEEAILAVTRRDIKDLWPLLAHEGEFVAAGPIKKMVSDLKRSGFSDTELGKKVNLKTGLRLLGKKYVRAYNARRIEKLYRQTGVAA